MNHHPAFVTSVALALALAAAPSSAQIARVFVSVNGNDGNACASSATPCRTLNGAIAQVDAQGEVIVVDSGSYAGATITKSVRVNVAPGVVAFSGLPIIVNPGNAGSVVLRGLTMKAVSPGTGNGIEQVSGTLFLENMVIDGWAVGLLVTSQEKAYVQDTTIRNNSNFGIDAMNGADVSADNVRFENNALIGLVISGVGTTATATRSVFSGNAKGVVVGDTNAAANLKHCQIASNGTGVQVGNSGVARLSGSVVSGNSTAFLINTAGVIESYGNNEFRGNGTLISGGALTTVALQ